eukprot:420358_1
MSHRTLASSFNDTSIQQEHAVAIWRDLIRQKRKIDFGKSFSKSENYVYYRVSVQNSQSLTHSYQAVNALLSAVSGFCKIILSDKYTQPNGRYVLDIRMPSKKKSQIVSWIIECFSELDYCIINY